MHAGSYLRQHTCSRGCNSGMGVSTTYPLSRWDKLKHCGGQEGPAGEVPHAWSECTVTITHTPRALDSFYLPPSTIAKQDGQQAPHTKKICFQCAGSWPEGIAQQDGHAEC